MFAIKINMTNEDDDISAIAKLQGLLDENGKWVFAWSQETKEKIFDPKNHTGANFAESKARYERCIKDSGRSFFDFITWTKTQGDESPFVTFEDRLSDAVQYASATNPADVIQSLEAPNCSLEILALRIDFLLQKARTSAIEYSDKKNESVGKLCDFARQVFHGWNSVGENLVAFLSEQDEAGLLVDGVRPQWYMFSTGKKSFAENLSSSLNYDLNKLQKDALHNPINIAGCVKLPQLVNETIMIIKIFLPKR